MMPQGKVSLPGAPPQIWTLPLDPYLLAEILSGSENHKMQALTQPEGVIAAQRSRVPGKISKPIATPNRHLSRHIHYPSGISHQHCCG